MKTRKKFQTHFEKTSARSAAEIKAACSKIRDNDQYAYDIRSNGNHIWVEVGKKKQQYWSPMLHMRLENVVASESERLYQTNIKGEFAENPLMWVVFLAVKILSIAVFAVALIVAYFKQRAGWNFNPELFIMFGMVSVWFGMYLISEHYKRKGARQIAALHDFVDCIAA